jgi:iron complex transport system ATP-binding protein
MTTPATLQAHHVHVSLDGAEVLHHVNLQLGWGWTALVGPNGAGKSTLLRVLAGLLAPHTGAVRLMGRELSTLNPNERARQIAWLGQHHEGAGELSVRETVALGRVPHVGLWADLQAPDHAAIDAAMALTECTAWADRPLSHLSGGERQRALLARALATQAPVLLLDEPTSHLDPPHQVALARLARRLARSHIVVTVVHDLPLALAADQVVVMQAGRVCAHAPAADESLHATLAAVFAHAFEVRWANGQAQVLPRW